MRFKRVAGGGDQAPHYSDAAAQFEVHLRLCSVPRLASGRNPTRKIICVSYNTELAAKHARDCRAVMNAAWYQSLFPSTRIDPAKSAEAEFMTTERGFRLATSTGGTLTGRGGDLLIIDDPMKPADAQSETLRLTVPAVVQQHVAEPPQRQGQQRHRARYAALTSG